MKRNVIESKIDQRYKEREGKRISTRPKGRGCEALARAKAENPKAKLNPGTRDEKLVGSNSTRSNKPR
jgi:hypothetical protein